MRGPRPETISDELIEQICSRLDDNRRVRRSLPRSGRLHIERQLPFLCVYRRPPGREDPGTDRLVVSEASYLVASGDPDLGASLSELARRLAITLGAHFGAFLVLEVWCAADAAAPPRVRIITPEQNALSATLEALEGELRRIAVLSHVLEPPLVCEGTVAPPGLEPLLSPAEAKPLRCFSIGLELPPFYRDPSTRKTFPLLLRSLRAELSRALQRAFHSFALAMTTATPMSGDVFGRRTFVRAVGEIDRRLSEVSSSFDFLLAVTPINTEEAWKKFVATGCEHEPVFAYREIPVDPQLLLRKLYQIPLERCEDPVLEQIFREKQSELARHITMVLERSTPRFLLGSLQVYGDVSDRHLRMAEALLERLPAGGVGNALDPGAPLDAVAFAERAHEELEHYRRIYPKLSARVQVREDMFTGLLVSRGNLLIGHRTTIPAHRADALLQHEVGTHIVTYFNGRVQPFRLLYSGLAGYESLQEGLAVLAEYLVGGLSRERLRLIAARAVAVRHLVSGASFVETFRILTDRHRFDAAVAFTVAMRVYRGGGLTKDAVYLRGLVELLEHVNKGGELEPLFLGRFALRHLPVIEALQLREVLRPPPLRPRYLERVEALERLDRLRSGLSVLGLVDAGSD